MSLDAWWVAVMATIGIVGVLLVAMAAIQRVQARLGRAYGRIRLLELHSDATRADVQKLLRTWGGVPDACLYSDPDPEGNDVPHEVKAFEVHLAAVARDLALDVDGDPLENTADVQGLTESELLELHSMAMLGATRRGW